MPAFYAHSLEDEPVSKWQKLEDHLRGVAERAEDFAREFGAGAEARVAGLLHDLGKFREDFQSYLKKECEGGINTHHAPYGAALAFEKGWPCAFAIAGHHAGLHDRHQLQEMAEDPRYHAESELPVLRRRFGTAVGDIPGTIAFPPFIEPGGPLSFEFYVRMLFSCLVDADYLDTSEYYSGEARTPLKLTGICGKLLELLTSECNSKSQEGRVNEIRRAVFAQCLDKAPIKQGCFSLTVPTGGGKTLSGMAFALAHAKRWGIKRVIVVIPYLSIIEQNAAEYRRILDPEDKGVVIEHHSAAPSPDGEEGRNRSPQELAAENWDAPVIVTTSVQFIESLFASSPSKCRKLHNIAHSVVVLDEVQTLPTHLLNPLLSVFRELRENYGVSFLFMTATQPAFRHNATSLPERVQAGRGY